MKNSKILNGLAYLLILVIAFGLIWAIFGNTTDDLTYSQVMERLEAQQVSKLVLKGDVVQLTLNRPFENKESLRVRIADPDAFWSDNQALFKQQKDAGILESYDRIAEKGFSPFSLVIPALLVGIVLLVIWAILAGRASANNPMANFGKARTVKGQPGKKITFADVAGVDEEKEELQEVVDFLSNPQKFQKIGARIPHGILLSGPPGTGKTLLAKAVAGEADAQFLSISGSDFMEMYVGVGASRVRDLFDQARRVAPSIIFIDEIDAVGRKRGSGLGGGHDEREQTLNQLLVELDGFVGTESVIVLAATNRPDILDPALLRPGRFDRQIYVGAPDVKGREDILKIHAKGKCLSDDVDLHVVALTTSGFTGADLANLINEAAIMAARADRPMLTMQDLNDAMMKIIAGPEKRSRVRLERDRKLTAIHEAGHAVAMHSLPTHDPVHQISIIPRGYALGLTWSFPKEDSDHLTRNEMFEQIVGLLGGRVAEALFLQDISTGASSDIDRATKLARDMVARYGMCEKLGTVSYTGGGELFIGRDYQTTKSYSEQVAGTIDQEVQALIGKAYAQCEDILRRDADKLKQVVEFLLIHETMTGDQFADCMAGREIRSEAQKTVFQARQEKEEDTSE